MEMIASPPLEMFYPTTKLKTIDMSLFAFFKIESLQSFGKILLI